MYISLIMQKQNFFIFHRISMKVILTIKLTENNLNRTMYFERNRLSILQINFMGNIVIR